MAIRIYPDGSLILFVLRVLDHRVELYMLNRTFGEFLQTNTMIVGDYVFWVSPMQGFASNIHYLGEMCDVNWGTTCIYAIYIDYIYRFIFVSWTLRI